MSLAVRFQFEDIRSIAFGSIDDTTYAGVGSAISRPARQVYITNNTDGDMMFSFNGVTDNFFVPSLSFILLDITSNKTQDSGFFLAQGERLYVRYITAPTKGDVYFSVMGSVD